ncbi:MULTISPECIES: response regulator transcription factor [Nonomuraea]|uniref:response regulator transcription factor n=1 Tax=Nonomuraea TaxID=83681 RepID=UPI001C5DFF22|nr:response regulator transcription factor [Nonomuraea ceibae]
MTENQSASRRVLSGFAKVSPFSGAPSVSWSRSSAIKDIEEAIEFVRHGLTRQREALRILERTREQMLHEGPAAGPRQARQYGSPAPTPVAGAERHGLTSQEIRVLSLIGRGMSNRQIAGALDIAEKTVKNYVHAIFRKLDVRSRTEAALFALREGWVIAEESRLRDSG